MRVVLVVPGGVDPPGSERVIPFVHHLVRRLSAMHDLQVIAVGHDAEPGEWDLFGAQVVNVPVGTHSKGDIARVTHQVSVLAGRGGRPDVVHGLWATLSGFAAAAAAHRYHVPAVVSVCGGEFAAVADIGYGGGLRTGTRLMATAATRSATVVTAATRWMVGELALAGVAVDELVPLGADLGTFCRPAHPERRAPDSLVHVANINAVKDQQLLVRAFAALGERWPAATLQIVGLDTTSGEISRLAESLGVHDRVTFHGHRPPDEVARIVRSAAIHVLTSRHDAGPVAVLEAAACGVPTVGTPVGHVADLAAATPPAAVSVAPASDAIAAALDQLISDEGWRDAMGDAAHEWAVAHDELFTARCFDAIYRRLAANR